jgi:hypothetical protein
MHLLVCAILIGQAAHLDRRSRSGWIGRQPVAVNRPEELVRQVLADIDGKLFASVPETAVVLRSDERAVRRMLVAGEIPGTQVGRVWRVPVRWIRAAAGLDIPA